MFQKKFNKLDFLAALQEWYMGVDLEPWFMPMKSSCNASEDARALALHELLFLLQS
jgi:hypothetical protein